MFTKIGGVEDTLVVSRQLSTAWRFAFMLALGLLLLWPSTVYQTPRYETIFLHLPAWLWGGFCLASAAGYAVGWWEQRGVVLGGALGVWICGWWTLGYLSQAIQNQDGSGLIGAIFILFILVPHLTAALSWQP